MDQTGPPGFLQSSSPPATLRTEGAGDAQLGISGQPWVGCLHRAWSCCLDHLEVEMLKADGLLSAMVGPQV